MNAPLLKWSPHLAPVACLLALVGLVFAPAIFSDHVFYRRDIHAFWYPQIEAFVRTVFEGSVPLWNPYEAFGAVQLANPSLQLAYPPTWLNLLLPPAAYYKLFVVGHAFLAAAGFFALARARGLSAVSACVGASTFALSGAFLSAASLFHHFAGVAFMPWVLMALRQLMVERRLVGSLHLGALAGCQLLAGSADAVLMTWVAGAFLTVEALGGRQLLPARGRLLGRLGLALLLAGGLAGLQWVPTLAVVAEGWRLRLSPATNLYWSLHPWSLADLLVPGLVARFPLNEAVRAAVFEGREPFLEFVYLGAAGLPLAALALATRGRRRVVGLLGLGFFLLCALGRHGPLLPSLLALPGFGVVRFPVKYLWGAALFWALLVAEGLAVWSREWSEAERRRGWRVAIMAALAALGAVAGAAALGSSASVRLLTSGAILGVAAGLVALRSRRSLVSGSLTVAFTILVLADLVSVGRSVNDLAPPELMRHRPPALEFLPTGARIHAVLPSQRASDQIVSGPEGWEPAWSFALGGMDRLTPPTGMRWGLRGSFDGDFTGLSPREYSDLVTLARAADGRPQGRTLLQRGGVGYVVTQREGSIGGLREVATLPSVFARPVRVLEVPDPFPLVYVVEGLRPASTERGILALSDSRFPAEREAIVSEDEPFRESGEGFLGRARVVKRSANELLVAAELNRPGRLVVLEAFQSAWRAEVDGADVPVRRVNVIFRGVELGPGRHVVHLRYRPVSAFVGAVSTLTSLGALFVLWVRARRSSRDLQARAA